MSRDVRRVMRQLPTALERYQASMTEAQMLSSVQGKIKGLGGQSMHIRRAEKQDLEGWPDVVGVVPIDRDPDGPHLLVAVEIKTANDKRNAQQDEWIRRLGLVAASSAAILRAGRPKNIDELDLDNVLELIELQART